MNTIVSVVYVNYNCSALTLDSIESLTNNCKDVAFEVIVVDNASEIEEKDLLKTGIAARQWRNVKLIYSDKNLGFGKANNLGAINSNGKYIFFLNPDTLVCNNVLKIFSEFLSTSERSVVACGGNLQTADAKPNASFGNFPGLMQELGNLGLGLSLLLGNFYKRRIAVNAVVEKEIPFRAEYVVGADIFILADFFRELDGFDEGFFMYYEETDLFYRLSKKGLHCFIVPEAKIVHFEGGAINAFSSGYFNYAKFEMLLSSKLYYYSKWRPAPALPFFKLLFFVQVLAQFSKGRMGPKLRPLLRIFFSTVSGSKRKQGSPSELS